MLLLVHPQFVDRWEYSKDQPSLPLVSPSQNEFEMSRYFVQERNWGFFAKAIVPWLSPYITVACGESISLQELGKKRSRPDDFLSCLCLRNVFCFTGG